MHWFMYFLAALSITGSLQVICQTGKPRQMITPGYAAAYTVVALALSTAYVLIGLGVWR